MRSTLPSVDALLFDLPAGKQVVILNGKQKMSSPRYDQGARLSLLASLLMSSFPVSAQLADAASLPPVVVTASRLPQLQSETLPHTTVITAQQIKDSQAVDLPSLLAREAGLQITQNGGPGAATGMFLRGADTRQTLVMIDGVPMTKQDATGSVSIEHLMLDQIDHIEIVRGNVSSIYGSGAVGGVIQIFTKAGRGAPGTSATVEAGSRGTYRLSASTRGSAEGLSYGLAVSDYITDGFSALNTRQIPTANPDKDGYRNQTINGSLAKTWRDGQEFGLRLSHTVGNADYDVSGGKTTKHETRTEVNAITLFSNNRITEDWTSRLSYSQFGDDSLNRVTAASSSRERYQTRTQTAEWSNEITLSSSWRATAGANRQWQNFISEPAGARSEYERAAYSMFGGLQGNIDRHQFQLNARHDETGNLSADSGYAGYGYQLDDRLKLIASVSNAFSAPPLGYLYGAYGNPSLKPEYSRSVEAGIQYADGPSIVRATVFQTRTTDQFQWVTTDFLTFDGELRNVKKTRNQGVELSAVQHLSAWELRASLTLQEPVDLATDERLIRRPRVLGSFGAVNTFDKWRVGGDLSYTGSRYDYDLAGTTTSAAYWLANLTARYQIDKNLSVLGRVQNLFDESYQTAWGYNQPPRGVFVGLSWRQ